MKDENSFPGNHEKGMFEARDGFRLFERRWMPEKPAKAGVIIVHGLAEHSGRYRHVAEYLVGKGYGVHTFDLRNHGRSGSPTAYVRSFDDYLSDLEVFLERTAAREAGKPLFILGHSLGGTIATLYAITKKPSVTGILLSGAALKTTDDVPAILITLSGIIGAILPKLPTVKLDCTAVSRDPKVVKDYDADPLNYRGGTPARTGAEFIKATRLIQEKMELFALPVLIMHGTVDRLADVEGSRQLYARAASSDKTLKLYEGLYHEILNEPEQKEVLKDIEDWLEARVTG
ncbi:MAG: lysophospholipase [Deltaproteobacteria bacterium]|nr:lysophospholipase [Deltaproteobacteria bacterium]